MFVVFKFNYHTYSVFHIETKNMRSTVQSLWLVKRENIVW